MTLPLVVLAFFAVTAGWIGIPHAFPVLGQFSNSWLQGFLGSMLPAEEIAEGHWLAALPEGEGRGSGGSSSARIGACL